MARIGNFSMLYSFYVHDYGLCSRQRENANSANTQAGRYGRGGRIVFLAA
jgi:hypothetical protein